MWMACGSPTIWTLQRERVLWVGGSQVLRFC